METNNKIANISHNELLRNSLIRKSQIKISDISNTIKCVKGHSMKKFSKISCYNEDFVMCNECKSKNIEQKLIYLHCSLCNYDICEECCDKKVNIFNISENGYNSELSFTTIANNTSEFINSISNISVRCPTSRCGFAFMDQYQRGFDVYMGCGVTCDYCSSEKLHESHIDNPVGEYYFHCTRCQFDLCYDCAMKLSKKSIKDKNILESKNKDLLESNFNNEFIVNNNNECLSHNNVSKNIDKEKNMLIPYVPKKIATKIPDEKNKEFSQDKYINYSIDLCYKSENIKKIKKLIEKLKSIYNTNTSRILLLILNKTTTKISINSKENIVNTIKEVIKEYIKYIDFYNIKKNNDSPKENDDSTMDIYKKDNKEIISEDSNKDNYVQNIKNSIKITPDNDKIIIDNIKDYIKNINKNDKLNILGNNISNKSTMKNEIVKINGINFSDSETKYIKEKELNSIYDIHESLEVYQNENLNDLIKIKNTHNNYNNFIFFNCFNDITGVNDEIKCNKYHSLKFIEFSYDPIKENIFCRFCNFRNIEQQCCGYFLDDICQFGVCFSCSYKIPYKKNKKQKTLNNFIGNNSNIISNFFCFPLISNRKYSNNIVYCPKYHPMIIENIELKNDSSFTEIKLCCNCNGKILKKDSEISLSYYLCKKCNYLLCLKCSDEKLKQINQMKNKRVKNYTTRISEKHNESTTQENENNTISEKHNESTTQANENNTISEKHNESTTQDNENNTISEKHNESSTQENENNTEDESKTGIMQSGSGKESKNTSRKNINESIEELIEYCIECDTPSYTIDDLTLHFKFDKLDKKNIEIFQQRFILNLAKALKIYPEQVSILDYVKKLNIICANIIGFNGKYPIEKNKNLILDYLNNKLLAKRNLKDDNNIWKKLNAVCFHEKIEHKNKRKILKRHLLENCINFNKAIKKRKYENLNEKQLESNNKLYNEDSVSPKLYYKNKDRSNEQDKCVSKLNKKKLDTKSISVITTTKNATIKSFKSNNDTEKEKSYRITCPLSHPLIYKNENCYKGKGTACDLCYFKISKKLDKGYYHCDICEYDICYKCVDTIINASNIDIKNRIKGKIKNFVGKVKYCKDKLVNRKYKMKKKNTLSITKARKILKKNKSIKKVSRTSIPKDKLIKSKKYIKFNDGTKLYDTHYLSDVLSNKTYTYKSYNIKNKSTCIFSDIKNETINPKNTSRKLTYSKSNIMNDITLTISTIKGNTKSDKLSEELNEFDSLLIKSKKERKFMNCFRLNKNKKYKINKNITHRSKNSNNINYNELLTNSNISNKLSNKQNDKTSFLNESIIMNKKNKLCFNINSNNFNFLKKTKFHNSKTKTIKSSKEKTINNLKFIDENKNTGCFCIPKKINKNNKPLKDENTGDVSENNVEEERSFLGEYSFLDENPYEDNMTVNNSLDSENIIKKENIHNNKENNYIQTKPLSLNIKKEITEKNIYISNNSMSIVKNNSHTKMLNIKESSISIKTIGSKQKRKNNINYSSNKHGKETSSYHQLDRNRSITKFCRKHHKFILKSLKINSKLRCDNCLNKVTNISNSEENIDFYNCPICNLDLCRKCTKKMYKKRKINKFNCFKQNFKFRNNKVYRNILRERLFTNLHKIKNNNKEIYKLETLVKCPKKHALKNLGITRDNGWVCDGRYKKKGCKRGINQIFQSGGIDRYRCELCDFDMCDLCYLRELNMINNNNSSRKNKKEFSIESMRSDLYKVIKAMTKITESYKNLSNYSNGKIINPLDKLNQVKSISY